MHPALRKGPRLYKTPPIFHFFYTPPFPTFLQKHLPIFPIFTKSTPISFPAYGPAILSTTAVMKSVIKINMSPATMFSAAIQ